MSPQIACLWGCKVTLVAPVCLFPTMHFQMYPQSAWLRGCIFIEYWIEYYSTNIVHAGCIFSDSQDFVDQSQLRNQLVRGQLTSALLRFPWVLVLFNSYLISFSDSKKKVKMRYSKCPVSTILWSCTSQISILAFIYTPWTFEISQSSDGQNFGTDTT